MSLGFARAFLSVCLQKDSFLCILELLVCPAGGHGRGHRGWEDGGVLECSHAHAHEIWLSFYLANSQITRPSGFECPAPRLEYPVSTCSHPLYGARFSFLAPRLGHRAHLLWCD